MNKFPAVGWVRATKVASAELLTEINDLRKQNAQLVAAAVNFKPTIENLAGLEDKIKLHGTYRRNRVEPSTRGRQRSLGAKSLHGCLHTW
jgi:hypothetical protein